MRKQKKTRQIMLKIREQDNQHIVLDAMYKAAQKQAENRAKLAEITFDATYRSAASEHKNGYSSPSSHLCDGKEPF